MLLRPEEATQLQKVEMLQDQVVVSCKDSTTTKGQKNARLDSQNPERQSICKKAKELQDPVVETLRGSTIAKGQGAASISYGQH